MRLIKKIKKERWHLHALATIVAFGMVLFAKIFPIEVVIVAGITIAGFWFGYSWERHFQRTVNAKFSKSDIWVTGISAFAGSLIGVIIF